MRARARGMTLSMAGIGLFKTQGLDEYGTAAVGWLRGAGLKATEGPAERRGGGIQALAHTLTHSAMHNAHMHARTPRMAHTHTDKTSYHMNNSDASSRTVDAQSFRLCSIQS